MKKEEGEKIEKKGIVSIFLSPQAVEYARDLNIRLIRGLEKAKDYFEEDIG